MARAFKVTVEKNRCKGCELCVHVCPEQVLAMSKEINDKGYFISQVVDQPACKGCRFCAFMCPDVAIGIEEDEARGEKREARGEGANG